MTETAVLTATQAYEARKIKLATSGMKIALLMPLTAILQNIFNQSVTETVAATLADQVILSIICSITLIGICDIFAGVFTFIYNAARGKGIPEYKRTAGFKVSWMMLLAAAVAGPMATGLWMAATPFAGLTMVAVITSLAPILTVVVSRFFLKENLSPRVYVGVAITVTGVIIAGWSEGGEAGTNFVLGCILALMAPIGFTLEAQFSTYAGDMIDPNVGCGFYRCFGSGIIGLAAMTILSAATGNIATFGTILTMVFSTPLLLLFVVIMGLLGAVNYNAAYLAFNRTGPSRTLAIDSSRPVWSIPLGFLFAALGIATYSVTAFGIVGAVIVVAGLVLVISKPSELLNLRSTT
jgi:drug/metabolite transporter (DMT)-like permease